MRCPHSINILAILLIVSLGIVLQMGCKGDGDTTSPSTPSLLEEEKKPTVEVTIGGKGWTIDPKRSYQETGVWTNPNPRLLTKAERERIQALPVQIQKLETQLDELDKELRYLERIEETEIKMRYNFGEPPDFSNGGTEAIIDLGEFPMEMENPTKIPAEQ